MLAVVLAKGVNSTSSNSNPAAAGMTDEQRIDGLIQFMQVADLNSLPSIPVERFALPEAGVDVMRVRLEETYDVAGVGKDTVELRGWIAVKHDNSRPALGETDLSWETAVTDTEFVAMELRGDSPIFGPVHITLDKANTSKRARGQAEPPLHHPGRP